MESILFIIKSNSRNRDIAELSYLPPLGVMSISTILEMHGYNVEIIDQSVTVMSGEKIIEKIKEINPIYVGISAYTENIDESLKLCKYIKGKARNTKIVLGGPHATMDPEYCKKSRFVDFIVLGEGEATNLEVAEAIRTNEETIKFSEIEGLIYRNVNNEFVDNKHRLLFQDLDLLPIIKRQYIGRSVKAQFVTISSSRGCPGRCIYCAAPVMSGNKYRIRNIENVFMETLLALKETDFQKEVYYIDDTFTAVIDRVKRFIEIVRESGVKFTFRCESRVDVLSKNKEVVKDLVDIGCQRLQYGIESGNQEVLNKIFKQMDLEEAEKLIEYSVGVGVRVAASFMFGHYCDTTDTMNDTVNLIHRLHLKFGNKVELVYGYNTPFPGTYQYEHREELGMKLKIDKFEDMNMIQPIVETANFTIKTQMDFTDKVKAVTM